MKRAAAIVALVGAAIVSSQPAAAQSVLTFGVGQTAPAGVNPGFDAELAAMIAERAGLEVLIETLPADDLLQALLAGEIDIAIGAVGLSEGESATAIAFTQTAVLNTGALVVAATSIESFTSLGELQDKTVGVQESSTWHEQLVDAGVAQIEPFPDFASAMSSLLAGEIDAYYTSRPVFLFAQHMAGRYCDARIVEAFINTAFPLSRLAVRADDDALLVRLDQVLSDLRSAGILLGGTFHYHPNDTHVAPLCVR